MNSRILTGSFLASVEVLEQEHIAQERARDTEQAEEERCISSSMHLLVGLPPCGNKKMH